MWKILLIKKLKSFDLDKTDEVSGKCSQKDVKGKTRVKGKIRSGGYFKEPTTDDEKDDDLKFKEKVNNEVKEDDGPKEDPVKKEGRSTHSQDILGNILLIMQACFIVIATKSCDRCNEMSKTLKGVSSHLEGWYVMDVYKPHKARMTIKTSSNCSNRYCYQFLTWTTGSDLKRVPCLGRLTKQMVDCGKLTSRRLVMWTQLNLEYLKGGVVAAQNGYAKGMFKLTNRVVRFGQWAEEKFHRLEAPMKEDQFDVLEQ